jgi:hypothetical protein
MKIESLRSQSQPGSEIHVSLEMIAHDVGSLASIAESDASTALQELLLSSGSLATAAESRNVCSLSKCCQWTYSPASCG